MSKMSSFRTTRESQYVRKSEKNAPQHFHHIVSSLSQKSELENVRLSVSEILAVFVNTLSADCKYSLRNRKNS